MTVTLLLVAANPDEDEGTAVGCQGQIPRDKDRHCQTSFQVAMMYMQILTSIGYFSARDFFKTIHTFAIGKGSTCQVYMAL